MRKQLAGIASALVVSVGCLTSCSEAAQDTPASSQVDTEPPTPDSQRQDPSNATVDEDVASIQRLALAAEQVEPNELTQYTRLEQARALATCAPLSWGGLYCLGLGFRAEEPTYRDLLVSSAPGETTGDLTFADWLTQRASIPRQQRLKQQELEAQGAISGLDKLRPS